MYIHTFYFQHLIKYQITVKAQQSLHIDQLGQFVTMKSEFSLKNFIIWSLIVCLILTGIFVMFYIFFIAPKCSYGEADLSACKNITKLQPAVCLKFNKSIQLRFTIYQNIFFAFIKGQYISKAFEIYSSLELQFDVKKST